MTRYHIAGIDLSLTGTGVARIRPHDEKPISLSLISSASVKNAQYPDTLARIRSLVARTVRAADKGAEEGDVVIYVMEGPVFGKMMGQYHTRAGQWWLTYHILEKRGPLVVIEPSKLKSYVTGDGTADKEKMLASIVAMFPYQGIVDHNEADALGLACMASRELGFPMEPSIQKIRPAALEGVHWPDIIKLGRQINS